MANSTDPGEKPEPQMDPPPDDGPGGPADMVRDEEGTPAVADQPRSAQVEDEHVPDEIEESEEKDKDVDEDEKNVDEGTEEPAG